MDYRDDEYLKLFQKIKEDGKPKVEEDQLLTSKFGGQMLNETPNYDNYNNINEVRNQNYNTQEFNLNEFNIETRVNGQNVNDSRREEKEQRLNEVMQNRRLEEERLFEVLQQQKAEQEKMDMIKKQQQEERQRLNETVDFKDADYISVEIFEKARYNAMMGIATRILPK